MSTEMSEIKTRELEELAKQEAEDKERMAKDRCPHCGAYVKDFQYFHPVIMRMGLFICNTCGVVFAPLSIRESIMRQQYGANAPTIIAPR
jgi:rubredoxin